MTDTQSVLDQMTAGIMGRKQERATSLTPVGMERPAITAVKGDTFPYDGGIGEQIIHSAKLIRSELASIEACLRSIERESGVTEGGPPPLVVDQKEASRQAVRAAEQVKDNEFKERFAKQQADAQSQVFVVSDAPPDNIRQGWICPSHGDSNVVGLKSKRGRDYRKCTLCEEFERNA
jgi:hypothetical protein